MMPASHSALRAASHHRAPAGACDAHMHVLDARFAPQTPILPHATVSDYQRLQAALGTTRTVVVQSRPFGTDNRVVLDAIRALGLSHARGVAVVHPEVTDAQLQQLHDGGVRGIRLSLYTPLHAAVDFSMVESLAHRVHPWGWHLQLHWTAEQLLAHAALLRRLPTPLVLDHLARLGPQGTGHPAYALVRELLAQGRTWVKLSGAYLNTDLGPAQGYADTVALAQALVQIAPQRVVWGSDWPHVTEAAHPPDDAQLWDLLAAWAPSQALRHQVLVDNPQALYGFDAIDDSSRHGDKPS